MLHTLVKLSPSRAWANVSRAGVYRGSACETELVRSGSVRDYSFHELRGEPRSRPTRSHMYYHVPPLPYADFLDGGVILGVGLFLPPSPDCDEFGESGLRWLSLSGVELFLPPSPDCAEFDGSGLRWLSGVELFLPPVRIGLSSANQD
ncbi:hypothetical protein AgCh_032357 [Apium graveolens]